SRPPECARGSVNKALLGPSHSGRGGLGFFHIPTAVTPSGTSLNTRAAAPITQLFPMLRLLEMVELTPRKQASPTRQKPGTTTCEETKQSSPIVEWWPIWLPLQRTTLFPIVTNGWTTLFSKMKQCSPTLQLRQMNACGLMYEAG